MVVIKPDPLYLPKVSSSFHWLQEVVLPSLCTSPRYSEQERFTFLDMERCLLHYLEISSEFRKSFQLLVSFSGPRNGNKGSI